MANQNQAQKPSAAALYAKWRNNTRQQVVTLPSINLNQFSQIGTIQIRPVGYLADLYVSVQGTVTVGGTSITGNFATYPPSPWNIIKSLRLPYTITGDMGILK